MFVKKGLVLFCCSFCICLTGFSQQIGNYDQRDAFSPIFYPAFGDEVRTAAGTPGPKYWQNAADYKIQAELDDVNHRITGKVSISYHNNSPQSLPFLWLQLDQNIYRSDSRAEYATPPEGGRYANPGFEGGYTIRSVSVDYAGKTQKINYQVSDTRMQIFLEQSLAGKGDSLKINIDYAFDVPEKGTDRMGRLKTSNGWIYAVAQWFPRMCVFDNVLGWNTQPYLSAGEFYLEYGNYDYTITTSSRELVVASGELQNPSEVLTPEQVKRLNAARNSDQTVMIRTEEEVKKNTGRLQKDKLVWHFKCDNARDVAFGASSAFIWDAARINLPDGKKSLAMSAYPIESARDTGWKKSTQFIKGCVEGYSNRWFPYPYPTAVNVASNVSGMEYPGIVFCYATSFGKELWDVIRHEFGHTWFPMIVGSNERRYAWMDEGFNTFLNSVEDKDYNKGEFYRFRSYRDRSMRYFQSYTDPIMTMPDVTQPRNLGTNAYNKPGMGLELLRSSILGEARFDSAFKYYIRNWAYKHPTPWDFFHAIENASGEDLSWFWKGWFLYNWKVDQAVTAVNYIQGNPANGAMIIIQNREKLPMPVTLEVVESGGKKGRISLPVEIWQRGGEWKLYYPSTRKIDSVTVDPDRMTPDIDDSNNVWRGTN